MASTISALRPSQPHVHVPEAQCPLCDQPIPNEKAEQVRARLEARERELSEVAATRLKAQFAAEVMLDNFKTDGGAALKFCSDMGQIVGGLR